MLRIGLAFTAVYLTAVLLAVLLLAVPPLVRSVRRSRPAAPSRRRHRVPSGDR